MQTESKTCPCCGVAKDFIYVCTISPSEAAEDGTTARVLKCPTCKVLIASA